MHKKLLRSRDNRMVSGVMGGLGKYLNMDPVVLRLLLIVVILITGIFPGVIAYIIAAFFIPEEPYIVEEKIIADDSISV
jgi:phage shock protein C